MTFPENLKYTKEHEWILIEEDKATIGITEFAQSELGDIIYVETQKPSTKELTKDTVFGTVEAVKTVSDLFMPISGKIIETNPLMDLNPELVNLDPYKEGWMVKVQIENREEIQDLLTAEEYKELVGY
jgi:glycine cleavage system H protein